MQSRENSLQREKNKTGNTGGNRAYKTSLHIHFCRISFKDCGEQGSFKAANQLIFCFTLDRRKHFS